jgi:RHS repeat-associated protein
VPLHEWKTFDAKEAAVDDMITWIFEENSFVPVGKIKGNKTYSIATDHLGTPYQGFDEQGKIWEREIDSFGKARMLTGDEGFCNYFYQGQTLDAETGLAYNRFRYYDCEAGAYISQDPIGLLGGWTPYSYVSDTNGWVDFIGLAGQRWADKVKKDGTLYRKLGPQSKGTGDHNAKIDEIIPCLGACPHARFA